jgi:hypothetical protein
MNDVTELIKALTPFVSVIVLGLVALSNVRMRVGCRKTSQSFSVQVTPRHPERRNKNK